MLKNEIDNNTKSILRLRVAKYIKNNASGLKMNGKIQSPSKLNVIIAMYDNVKSFLFIWDYSLIIL